MSRIVSGIVLGQNNVPLENVLTMMQVNGDADAVGCDVSDAPQSTQTAKQKLKNDVKHDLGKKFTVGETLILKTKVKGLSKIIKKEFIVKKFIYTVNEQNVSILILKRVNGSDTDDMNMRFTLNVNDCKTLHVKFEHGLEVWPMCLNWVHKKDN